ncbi:leucine/isoleucine/valine transporter subunit; ATP-binding component of ABC superfamily [Methylocella tundrae]|uniref:Leucine/isoleucine/valine transporter subunit ATP-binding component of ABC superfamily n=1 Tax=Methylocella tundrae TaxID=227605 RepID=A0A8B6MAC0_METTU|nr:ABC transporter ATP-binding protein [Methylocella tundrae]VTZ28501.1 leucine/isoleucine/valine transporter subunit; ATP-binding component of ABC superfamily [Methylocella tundrae]VTZ51052.1 leucine/isoleucine/valine transporter subunit; ATP-binding component of ABC superfamily [Methylocella tundrae]
MTAALLQIEALTLRYGGLTAIDSLDLTLEAGSLDALIGPNGAGKTSFFNLVTGLNKQQAGTIRLDGARIDSLSPDRRARRGLARTFQNLRLFTQMTALENVLTGMHLHVAESLFEILTRLGQFRSQERAALREAKELLSFVGLAAAAHRPAGALSYGDQRRLEIARALASTPKLLLLDEPAAGMNPAETAALKDLLLQIKGRGVSMLLVEHDMSLVMQLCDKITVLNFGRKIAEGAPAAVRADSAVIEAYLGVKGAGELRGAGT